MRSLGQLQAEAQKLGITIRPSGRGGKPCKDDYEVAIRNFLFVKKHGSLDEMIPQIEPQKAQKLNDYDDLKQREIWNDPMYIAQLKLDGCRFLCHIGPFGNKFTSRRKSDRSFLYMERTNNLPYLRDAVLFALAGTVLDGEVKMNTAHVTNPDNGETTVTELQATISAVNGREELSLAVQKQFGSPTYHVFDILYHNGQDVRNLSYHERIKLVDQVVAEINNPLFNAPPVVRENKQAFYEDIVAKGGEGVMLKRLDAPYEDGKRAKSWLKVKRFDDFDGVITGAIESDDKKGWADLIGGLEISAYDEAGQLRAFASVSSMPLEFRKSLTKTVDGKPALIDGIIGRVVVVRGQEFTKEIRIKHATWQPYGGWSSPYRTDKAPEDCKIDFKLIEAKVEAGERA